MDINIREFIKKYEEGRYGAGNSAAFAAETDGEYSLDAELLSGTYQKDFIQWMGEVYGAVSGITNRLLLGHFYLSTRCDEQWRRMIYKQKRILLVPYDRRLSHKHTLDIRIDDTAGRRKYWLAKGDGSLYGQEVRFGKTFNGQEIFCFQEKDGLLGKLNSIRQEGGAVQYCCRLISHKKGMPAGQCFLATVPYGITPGDVEKKVKEKYASLNAPGAYGETGCSLETLMDEVCKETGWACGETGRSLEIALD